MNLHCIIVDDEPVARKVLREYIEDIPFIEVVGEAENPLKAHAILEQQPVHLMFLDINMPKLTGIEFLRSNKSLPPTIMTTAYAEHALDGFTLDVLDYLVKPFSFERFLKACNKAKDYWTLKTNAEKNQPIQENYFFVKCSGRIEKVAYDDLLFIEAALNYVILHTVNGKMIVYLTIKSILESLPPALFIKVHKSFVVNSQKINSIEGNIIHIGKSEIPIRQNSQDEVIKLILKDRMLKR
ncbi:MAG TPA: LytTR family DNA-binding domain-containing protein [Chitinophagaceae bacterium]|nr:LytTR family DNA-binding domain-containing protein [Chitinophagaceae bacterium]